jgi:hypothetical protein
MSGQSAFDERLKKMKELVSYLLEDGLDPT